MKKAVFYLVALPCLLTACSSINYINIETYNPAEVTFPDNIAEILVVNNAVPQPSDAAYTFKYQGVEQDTCRAPADSAIVYTFRSLGVAINEGDYFNDVLLYDSPLRTDDQYLVDGKLSSDQVTQLCAETETDAVISLDRMLFKMEKNLYHLAPDLYQCDILVEVSGIIRAYLPGRESPLVTIHLEDSVYWTDRALTETFLQMFLPSPEDALNLAGIYTVQKAYSNFVPHWNEELRWYFTGMDSKWKEATAYIQYNNWEAAAKNWEAIYNKSKKWETKAKAASNIALSHEVNGNLNKAYEWAKISFDLFNTYAKESKNKNLTETYVDRLAKRIYFDKKLDKQFGIE